MADDREPLTEEELVERLQEEMRRITVPDYLAHTLVSLSSMAFQRLGLTADTAADRDLDQARMAIDAFEVLSGVLGPGLGAQEASLYRSTLHQMRVAFVRALGDADAEEPGAPGAPGAGGPPVDVGGDEEAGRGDDEAAADAGGDDEAAAETAADEEA